MKHSFLRSLYTPYNHNPPPHVAPLPLERVQAGTPSETKTSGNLREASSTIDQRSNHGWFSYDQNSPHSKRPGTAVTEVWRGHGGGMRPASSRQPRGRYQPVNTNSYSNHPQNIRKSSRTKTGNPLYVLSQIWPPENAPKPFNEVKYPGVFSFKVAEDDFSLFSPPNGRYWTTALLTPRGRCTKNQEVSAAGVQSTSVPHAPSANQSADTFIKSKPSLEKRKPPVTDFTGGKSSVSGSETQMHKKAHAYPFQDSQTSSHERETDEEVISEGARLFPVKPHEQRTSAARGYSSVSSNLIRFQQSHHEGPPEEARHPPDDVGQPHHDTAGPHYGAQAHTLTTRPPVTSISSAAPAPAQVPSLPASGKALESLAPAHHAGSHDSEGPGSEQPVLGRPVNKATRGSVHDHTKRVYGFRGFKPPLRRDGTEPKANGFHKGNLGTFKSINTFVSKSPNSSFQGASTPTQADPETTPTRSSSAFSSSHTTESSPSARTESNIHMDKDQKKGAEADKPVALRQDFDGFQRRRSRFWQPRGSTKHGWYDPTGQEGPAPGKTSTRGQTEPQSVDPTSNLKAAGRVESVRPSSFSPDTQGYASLWFQPAQNGSRTHTQQSPSPDSPAPRASSAYLAPARGLTGEPGRKAEPESRPVNAPTSSMARGTRVKGKRKETLHQSVSSSSNPAPAAIVRLPKWPVSATYADVVGSALFSRVRVREDSFANSASRQKGDDGRQSSSNMSGRPEANAGGDVGDFGSVEEEKQSVTREGGDSGMETRDGLSKGERGASRPVNHVLWPYFPRSRTLGEEASELDRFRKPTGNVSVKSMSPPEKRWQSWSRFNKSWN